MKKEIFNEYCEFMFTVLNEYLNRKNIFIFDDVIKIVNDNSDDYLKSFAPNNQVNYQARIGGFLSERLFNIWLAWKNLKVKTIKTEQYV